MTAIVYALIAVTLASMGIEPATTLQRFVWRLIIFGWIAATLYALHSDPITVRIDVVP